MLCVLTGQVAHGGSVVAAAQDERGDPDMAHSERNCTGPVKHYGG